MSLTLSYANGQSYTYSSNPLPANENLRGLTIESTLEDGCRYLLKSVEESDRPHYIRLFTKPEAFAYYGKRKPHTTQEIATRVDTWINRWSKGNPFSALAIYHQKPSEESVFIGHVILGGAEVRNSALREKLGLRVPSPCFAWLDKSIQSRPIRKILCLDQDAPGISEMAYISVPSEWKKGHATHVAHLVTKTVLPFLTEQGYEVGGAPLKYVIATASEDNEAAQKLLPNAWGMEKFGQLEEGETSHGVKKDIFILPV